MKYVSLNDLFSVYQFLPMKKSLFLILATTACAASAQNPAISAMYTPDPAPYVHDGKVYLFVDHDEDDALYFKMKDWLLFSTDDMVNWTYLGTPVTTGTFAWAAQGDRAWASQAVEHHGKWYWYICCNTADGKDALGVAVADQPQGPYTDAIGGPLAVGFSFIDPTVFVDDDGTPYLFWGNKSFYYGELNQDMVSFRNGYQEVPGFHDPACFGPLQMKMDWSVGHDVSLPQYEEGPWVMKRGDTYYCSYPAGGVPEYMAYSTAPSIHGPWTFRGRIMDEAENSFTIHGGNITYKGHDYMFYHNGQLPNGGGFRRATCVEEFQFNADGSIPFIPFTREGVKPVGTVNPYQRVEAETMSQSWGLKLDRTAGDEHWVTSVHNGDWLRIREVDFGQGASHQCTIAVRGFRHEGVVEFYLNSLGGRPFAHFDVKGDGQYTVDVKGELKDKHDVYIIFRDSDEEMFDLDWWQLQ